MNNTEKNNTSIPSVPITISIENFKKDLVELIQKSELHPFILDSIIKDIYNEVHMLYKEQIIIDKKKYEEQLSVKENNIDKK